MVHQNSRESRAAGRLEHGRQSMHVFHILFADYTVGGEGLTDKQMQSELATSHGVFIPVARVSARRAELERGVLNNGTVYYVVQTGCIVDTISKRKNALWGISETAPATLEDNQREAILKDIKRQFKRLRDFDLARLREIRGLFDVVEEVKEPEVKAIDCDFKVGDRVMCSKLLQIGTVSELRHNSIFAVRVLFDDKYRELYTKSGQYFEDGPVTLTKITDGK